MCVCVGGTRVFQDLAGVYRISQGLQGFLGLYRTRQDPQGFTGVGRIYRIRRIYRILHGLQDFVGFGVCVCGGGSRFLQDLAGICGVLQGLQDFLGLYRNRQDLQGFTGADRIYRTRKDLPDFTGFGVCVCVWWWFPVFAGTCRALRDFTGSAGFLRTLQGSAGSTGFYRSRQGLQDPKGSTGFCMILQDLVYVCVCGGGSRLQGSVGFYRFCRVS